NAWGQTELGGVVAIPSTASTAGEAPDAGIRVETPDGDPAPEGVVGDLVVGAVDHVAAGAAPLLEQLEALIADGLGIEALAVDASDGEPADELDAIELGDEDDFGDVLIDTGDDDTTDVTPSVEADNDDASTDINLGDVTSFGEETNYASELNELEGALSEETETTETVESVDIELGEVTAFGTETNYASELDELSSSIQGGQESETDSEDFAIDVSGLEVEDDDAKEGGEFDLSDLELDLEDEDDEKEKK
ncbi:MAG: hypothetical protein KY410_10725, partial [Proteobacteria bacterium]|nr:hypothetical protein [Pseudomonadota bacterium]